MRQHTPSEAQAGGANTAAAQRRTLPVVVWAVVGAVFVAFQSYVYISWILSDRFAPTGTGPTPVPMWMKVLIRSFEVVSFGAFILVIVLVVIRPMRRDRRLSPDGLFILALLATYWQTDCLNFTQVQYTYNSYFVNMGAWYADIPGWVSPHGNKLAQPLLAILPMYGGVIILGCVTASKVLSRAKARWPRLSNIELFGICVVFMFAFDFVCEIVWLRTGFYTYAGTGGLALFGDHYYRVPLVPITITAFWYSAFAFVRHYRNDRGETVVERGITNLHLTARRQTFVRFLALAGALNMIWLVANVALQLPALHSSTWPQDVVERSYFTEGICGPGTDYACPGSDIPIPTEGSGHVRPDGSFAPASRPPG